MEPSTLEGTWEEILQHTAQLAGQRVRVTILTTELSEPKNSSQSSQNLSEFSSRTTSSSHQDPLSRFIGAVSHGSLAANLDDELYGG